MKILIDMNLSPAWVSWINQTGHEAVHWSELGNPKAKDSEILEWAKQRGYIVFTHDLDYSAILAATATDAPSVIQIRIQDITHEHCGVLLISVLNRFADELSCGALVSVDEDRARIRLLPLR